jgi:hypothetical protein
LSTATMSMRKRYLSADFTCMAGLMTLSVAVTNKE